MFKNEQGSALLEALVAVAVVGLAVIATLAALTAQLRAMEQARRYSDAVVLAEYMHARLAFEPLEKLHSRSKDTIVRDFDPPFDNYRWDLLFRNREDDPQLVDIGVRIHWKTGHYVLWGRRFTDNAT